MKKFINNLRNELAKDVNFLIHWFLMTWINFGVFCLMLAREWNVWITVIVSLIICVGWEVYQKKTGGKNGFPEITKDILSGVITSLLFCFSTTI